MLLLLLVGCAGRFATVDERAAAEAVRQSSAYCAFRIARSARLLRSRRARWTGGSKRERRWHVAGHRYQLEEFQVLLPDSDLDAGETMASKVIPILRAMPDVRHEDGTRIVLVLRRILRPLYGIDLEPIAGAPASDVARFRDFTSAIRSAGLARKLGAVAATHSTHEASYVTGEPNSLLARALIAHCDRPTQDAFGVHDFAL